MRVHILGNSPSPAVATYDLRKSVDSLTSVYRDVNDFVHKDFYVDDGLKSLSSPNEATYLMKNTQTALGEYGNLRLHKITSNSKEVVTAFSKV